MTSGPYGAADQADTAAEYDDLRGRDAVAAGALVLGWHHSTRSVAAHCFQDDHPLCQDSDPGEVIDRNQPSRRIGRVCEDCRRVYVARIKHAIRRAREARAEA